MKTFLLLLACLTLRVTTALSAEATSAAEMTAKLQGWLGEQPGGIAVARVDEKGVAYFNAGKFSRADARPVTPDTQFEIGSVTKVFTAVLFADSVRVGKVKPDEPVGTPFGASRITYVQLATHTSGLPRLPPGMVASDPANPYAEQDLAGLVKAFDAAAATAQPTEKAEYSNFGFAVLGRAVAGAWGSGYEALLRERVFGPLGLRDTVLSWREADAKRLAPGHNEQGPAANWDLAALAPAGGLVSTTRDLAVFLQACLGLRETPLAGVLAETAQPRVPGSGAGRQQGWAWIVKTRGASAVVWHGGATGGYRSFVGYDTGTRTGVVVLTNHTTRVDAVGMALLTGTELPVERVATAGAAAEEEGKDYVGDYPLTPSFVMAVTANAHGLWLQATNQPRLKLRRAAADRFAVEGVAAEVTFERGAEGTVVGLVLHQNGMNRRAPRLASAPVLTLSAAELDAYAGEYALGLLTFTVKRDGERLMVRLTGQPFFQVFASARDEFFYKVVEAQLSFVRGADGKVTALVLHQNGRDQRAEKR